MRRLLGILAASTGAVLIACALMLRVAYVSQAEQLTALSASINCCRYFTVWVNLLMLLSMACLVILSMAHRYSFYTRLKGFVSVLLPSVLFMVIVFHVILAPRWVIPDELRLVSFIFHALAPMLFVISLGLLSSFGHMKLKKYVAFSSLLPVLYLVLVGVPSLVSGSFPYPLIVDRKLLIFLLLCLFWSVCVLLSFYLISFVKR